MIPSLLDLTKEIVEELSNLGATHFSEAYNYYTPDGKVKMLSSVHFFKGNEIDKDGFMDEVAYFSPDMTFKNCFLSGFNPINRKNGVDIKNIRPIPYEDFIF